MENIEISLSEPDKTDEPTLNEQEVVKENGVVKETIVESDLPERFKEFETTISNLKDVVTKKTDVISDLEKQKGSLEKEVTHVSCDIVIWLIHNFVFL